MSDFSFFSASIILVLVFPVFQGLGGGLACCGPLSFTRTTSTASFLECWFLFFLLNVEGGGVVLPPDESIPVDMHNGRRRR